MSTQVAEIQVETTSFLPPIKPLGSSRTLFLAGAGVRGIQVPGKFMKVTAIGLYLEDGAVWFLASKWKGKTAVDLTESAQFIHDVIAAPFDRFVWVTMLLPLTGIQYSEKVVENCVGYLKSLGVYTDAEAVAVEKFLQVFRDKSFPPGASILFAQPPDGSTKVAFTKDAKIPETGKVVIENKKLSDAILESIIGMNGVSPTARQSLATRLSELMSGCKQGWGGVGVVLL